jgi:hypothetical protein
MGALESGDPGRRIERPVGSLAFCVSRPQSTRLWMSQQSVDERGAALVVVDLTIFLGYTFLQPRSFEGATGGVWRRSGVRRPRPRAYASTADPGRRRDRPGALRPHVDSSLTRCRVRSAPMLKTRRQREDRSRKAVKRRAERRRALRPFAKGRARHRRGVHCWWRHFGAPPLGLRGDRPRLAKAGNTTATVAPTKGRGGFRTAV